MKLNLALLGSVAALCAIPTQSQYFSKGWIPGQAEQEAKPTSVATATSGWSPGQTQEKAAAGIPGAPESKAAVLSFFDVNKLLVKALNKLGLNVTLPDVEKGLWDDRIPLIHDDNYQDIVVNELFASDEEASARTWALVITASSKGDAVSKFVDDMFDSAFNTSQVVGDLPHVRWGRIDYLNVTYITTKWNIWRAPYFVILKDRGQTLRFYRPASIRVREDAFLDFLKTEGYESTPPWSGLWAPGGEREWILHLFSLYTTKAYSIFVKIPKLFLYIISGSLGSVILSFLHRPTTEQNQVIREAQENSRKVEKATAAAAPEIKAAIVKGEQTPTGVDSDKKKKKSPRTMDTVSESSPVPNNLSPTKPRSSARQRKGKK